MRRKFQDQPIFRKISFSLFVIIMALVLVLSCFSILIYTARSNKWFYQESETAAISAKETLSMHYDVITRRFVSIFGNDSFASLILREQGDNNSVNIRQKDMQGYLADLQVSDYIIDSVMGYSAKTGNVFSYNWSSTALADTLLSDDDLSQIKGITWLTQRVSPLHKSTMTIPIIYPLTTDYKDYVTITNNIDYADVFIIVYLDYEKLKSELSIPGLEYRNTDSYEFYLFSSDKILLNAASDNAASAYEMLNTMSLPESPVTSSSVLHDKNNYWFLSPLKDEHLILLYHTLPNSFLSILGVNPNTLFMFALLVIIILAAISVLLSRYISKPIQIQADIVKEIEQGTYSKKIEFKTNDEIGRLNKAINQMYDTIQSQIEQIKKEESEKYVTQMLRTAEQVNPHFLYNTLDAIQAEVRKGNSKTAESMIQYLSEYMRIGLSYGDDFISIPQEIQHANAYIHLMEQRFGKKITFIHQIAPGLTDVQIPKTILQPLLENSIRHGFGIDADGMPVQLPTIEINFLLTEKDMVIDVSDNGSGFDESYVLSIMYNGKDGEKRHIGLHNVYYRLSSIYGKENVSIQAESIPYYKNEVKLSVAKDKVL